MQENPPFRKFIGISVWTGIILFSLGLAMFAYLGLFTRFWMDDWCYNNHFRNYGFFETLRGYHTIVNYASNRFSLTFFNGLFYYLGVFGSQVLALVIIVLWSAGIAFILFQLNQLFNARVPRSQLVLYTIVVVFFSIYLAPNRFQAIYWRSGALPYTFAILFGLLLTGYILYAARKQQSLLVNAAIAAPLAFLAGGFSEAGGAVLAAWWVWMILLSLLAKSKGLAWAPRMLHLSIIALAFSILALAALASSPANLLRQTRYGEPSSLLETTLKSIEYSTDFIYASLKATPLPFFAFSILFAGFGYLHGIVRQEGDKRPMNPLWLGVVLLAGYTLIIAMHAPSAFIEHVSPAIRTFVISQFILLVMAACGAFFSGYLVSRISASRWLCVLALAAVWSAYAYLVYAEQKVFSYELPRFQKIASVWDERNEKILSEKMKGNLDIEVRAIDSAYIGGLLEWYPEPHWVNFCAAEYYGVDAIRATIDW